MGLIIVPFAIAAAGVVFFLSYKRMQQIQETWRRAGTTLGLQHHGSQWAQPELRGTIGGLKVKVDVYTTGGKNKTHWTRYKAKFPQPGVAINLKRQTGLSRVTKLFGAQDAEVGDAVFDDAFMVKEDSAARAAQYLTLTRRTLLLKLFSLYRSVELTPNKLEIVIRGYEDDANNLVTHTRRMVSAARVLAGISDNEPTVRQSLEERLGGDMAAAAQRLRQARDTSDDVDTRILEAELLAESGRLEEAAPILSELADALPADEEVAGLRRAIGRMTPSEPAPGESSVDLQELLDDLFVSNRLSFETAEIFDEHYLDRDVTWSGVVKSTRDIRNDLDFRSGPGTKIVVAIAEVEHDLYGVSEVDAVVHVPAGAADHLSRGDNITFSGKLLKADSMMRNVFVRDGRLH